MIVDLSDFDASGWNHLTGTSGHTFHPNYVDQTEAWQRIELTPWAFTPKAVDAATTDTLTLTPPCRTDRGLDRGAHPAGLPGAPSLVNGR